MAKNQWITKILLESEAIIQEKQGPCWDGYERVPGTKEYTKGSCRKKEGEEEQDEVLEESEAALRRYIRNYLLEAIHDGKKVELNKPTSNPENPNKKSKVYVNSGEKYKSGEHKGQIKAKKVQFGDPNMRIKKSNPKARKSFRARHDCANKTDNKTAGYWSCKAW